MDTIILALALVLALAGLWLLNRATGNLIGSLLGFGIDKEGQTEAMIDQEKVNTGRKQMKLSNIILVVVVILLLVALLMGQSGG